MNPTALTVKSACLAGVLLTANLADAASRYTIADLGTIGGANGASDGAAINAAGAVAGSSALPSSEQSAAVFSQGLWTDLGALAVAAGTGWTNLPYARGINDGGMVTGYGFVTGGAGFHAFRYANGAFTDLNAAIGGSKSQGSAINASGQVAGFFTTGGVPAQVHAFLYSGGATAVDLGTLGGTYSAANALNAAGGVVGSSYASNGDQHAFYCAPGGEIEDLGTFAGSAAESMGRTSVATGINDAGVIVGYSNAPGVDALHAARYAGGKWTDLGTLGGRAGAARAVNAAGAIVGESEISISSSLTHAFVWEDGVLLDLNARLEGGAGWELLIASAINASGQITGQGTNAKGERHAYVLTPIPDVLSVRPVVRISGMKRLVTDKVKITIKGLATGEVTSVDGRVGDRAAHPAVGQATWRFKATLRPGKNVINITAHGPGGDSEPAKVVAILRR